MFISFQDLEKIENAFDETLNKILDEANEQKEKIADDLEALEKEITETTTTTAAEETTTEEDAEEEDEEYYDFDGTFNFLKK